MNRDDATTAGPIPLDRRNPPVFAAPWHAQAFAMAVSLHEGGAFGWKEWSEALGAELSEGKHAAGDDGYYTAWLTVLEAMVCRGGLVGRHELAERKQAWDRAARSTPHGKPITL